MTWFALQSLFLILSAFVLGVVVGWLGWGRQERQETIVVLHGDGTTPRTMTRPVEQPPVTAPVGTPAAPPPVETPAAAETTPAAAHEAAPAPGGTRPTPVAVGTTDDADETDDGAEQPEVVDLRDAAPRVVDLREADDATPDAPASEAEDAEASEADAGATEAAEAAEAAGTQAAHEPDDDAADDPDEEPEDDDLERIEGVTPKIAAALNGSGIRRYAELAACDEFRLRGILRSAGLRFSPSLPSWPEQAELLAEGDDEGFAELAARVAADRRTAGTA